MTITTTETAQAPRDPVMRVNEAARQLDVAPTLIYALVGRGALRHVRVGRNIRIPQSAVDEFIADGGTLSA